MSEYRGTAPLICCCDMHIRGHHTKVNDCTPAMTFMRFVSSTSRIHNKRDNTLWFLLPVMVLGKRVQASVRPVHYWMGPLDTAVSIVLLPRFIFVRNAVLSLICKLTISIIVCSLKSNIFWRWWVPKKKTHCGILWRRWVGLGLGWEVAVEGFTF